MTRSYTIDVAGTPWRVHEAGDGGPPLVLLHGGGVDSASLSYATVIEQLGRSSRVITPDLPGYGETALVDEPGAGTIEHNIEAVIRLLDALELDEVDLGGLSLGGGIALGLALAHPERVRRLVLLAPYGLTRRVPAKSLALLMVRYEWLSSAMTRLTFSSSRAVRWSLRSLIRNRDRLTDDVVDAVLREARSERGGDAWYRFQRSEIGKDGLRTCYLERLHEIEHPALLLAGGQDRLVPAADCRAAAELLPNAMIEVLEACGHWIARDQPEQLVDLVRSFREQPS